MAPSKDIEVVERINAELDAINSAQAALDLLSTFGVNLNDNDADGIRALTIIENKDELIRVPFIITRWRFNEGENGQFVSAELVKANDDRIYVLNDGSTGIFRQLSEITENRVRNNHPTPQAGRAVRGGLRKSEYDTTVSINGKDTTVHGITYYLAF